MSPSAPKIKKTAAACALLLAALPALAAEAPATGEKPYYEWFLDDAGSLLSSPARGDAEYWAKFAAAVATAGALYARDEEVAERITARRDGTKDYLAGIGNNMGDGRYLLPAMGLALAGGYVFESDYTVGTVKLAFESAVLSAAGVQLIKLSAHRHRPDDGEGPYKWDGPDFFSNNKDSFPSGHSAGAFSVASVLANRYGTDTWWAAPLIYSTAALTPLARVYDEKHWPSDAFMGAAIGYFTGKALARYHGGEGLSIFPLYSEEGPMLAVRYDF